MIQNNFLSPISKNDKRKVSRNLGMIWVLNIKDNGRYCSTLIPKGFLQRELIEYDLSHSPILCDINFLTLII